MNNLQTCKGVKWRLSQGQRQNKNTAECHISDSQGTNEPPSVHALVLNLGLAMRFTLVKGTIISKHGENRGLISTYTLELVFLEKSLTTLRQPCCEDVSQLCSKVTWRSNEVPSMHSEASWTSRPGTSHQLNAVE